MAHAVVNLLAANAPHIFDSRRDFVRSSEEDESLVDEVRAEVVRDAIRRGRHALPAIPDRCAVAIEPERPDTEIVRSDIDIVLRGASGSGLRTATQIRLACPMP